MEKQASSPQQATAMPKQLTQYAQQELSYQELRAFYILVRSAAGISKRLLIALLMVIAGLFLSIGAALWLSQVFDSTSLGFVAVGSIYLLLTPLTLAFKKKIEKYWISKFTKPFTDGIV